MLIGIIIGITIVYIAVVVWLNITAEMEELQNLGKKEGNNLF
jgi:hypothetical protein